MACGVGRACGVWRACVALTIQRNQRALPSTPTGEGMPPICTKHTCMMKIGMVIICASRWKPLAKSLICSVMLCRGQLAPQA